MEYSEYLKKLNVQSKKILDEILKQQKTNNLNLSYPNDKFNVLLMISNNLLALNGNKDLNFSLIIEILSDEKVFELVLKHFDKLLQASVINEVLPLILGLFIKRYSSLKIHSLTESEKIQEMTLLMNMKGNLSDKSQIFIEKYLITFINAFIFKYQEVEDMLEANLKLLFENLNQEVEDNYDLIFVSDYIFKLLKEHKIIN